MLSKGEMLAVYRTMDQAAREILQLWKCGRLIDRDTSGSLNVCNCFDTLSQCFDKIGSCMYTLDKYYGLTDKCPEYDWFAMRNISSLSLNGYLAYALIKLHASGFVDEMAVPVTCAEKVIPCLVELLSNAANNVMLYFDLYDGYEGIQREGCGVSTSS